MARGKPKRHHEYQYVAAFWHLEHMSLRTNRDGVRTGLITTSGLSAVEVEDLLERIDRGERYESTNPESIIKRLHREATVVEQRLSETFHKIRKGPLAECWWHCITGCILWSYTEAEDGVIRATGYSDLGHTGDEIRGMFMAHPEVKLVRVEKEVDPSKRVLRHWAKLPVM